MSYLVGNCLLLGAKWFSTISREEKLYKEKRLGEYGALRKRRSWKYKGQVKKKGPEKDKKPQEKGEEPQKKKEES